MGGARSKRAAGRGQEVAACLLTLVLRHLPAWCGAVAEVTDSVERDDGWKRCDAKWGGTVAGTVARRWPASYIVRS